MASPNKESKHEGKKRGKTAPSAEVIKQAESIAKGTQRPGQSKEQTKLIAQGIQKGIEQYKKQHKAKARELDKKLKQLSRQSQTATPDDDTEIEEVAMPVQNKPLPWILLGLSWLGFIAYVFW